MWIHINTVAKWQPWPLIYWESNGHKAPLEVVCWYGGTVASDWLWKQSSIWFSFQGPTPQNKKNSTVSCFLLETTNRLPQNGWRGLFHGNLSLRALSKAFKLANILQKPSSLLCKDFPPENPWLHRWNPSHGGNPKRLSSSLFSWHFPPNGNHPWIIIINHN